MDKKTASHHVSAEKINSEQGKRTRSKITLKVHKNEIKIYFISQFHYFLVI